LLAIRLGWFPIGGMENLRDPSTGLSHVRDVAYHLVLPCLVLATAEVAMLTRVTRSGLIEQLGSDYARTGSPAASTLVSARSWTWWGSIQCRAIVIRTSSPAVKASGSASHEP